MQRFPVSSSNVASVGYDQETKILEIEFTNGGVYQYAGVPHEVALDLHRSPSIGAYVAQNIRGKYPTTRVQ